MLPDFSTEEPAYELDAPIWDPEDEYPDYDTGDSYVISGPLGGAKFRGTRYPDWQSAKRVIEAKYKVIKFGCVPGRWMARIRRQHV